MRLSTAPRAGTQLAVAGDAAAIMSAPKRPRAAPVRGDCEARLEGMCELPGMRRGDNTRSLAFMALASSLPLLAWRYRPQLRCRGRRPCRRRGIGENFGLAGETHDLEAERVPAPDL